MEGSGDQRAAVLQGLTHEDELPELRCLLRALSPEGTTTEAFIAEESVYVSTVDGRSRALTVVREFRERRERLSSDGPLFGFSRDLVNKGSMYMFFEERDTRSSTDAVLVRRHLRVPVSDNLPTFLQFQGLRERSKTLKEGIRVPLNQEAGAVVTIFKVHDQSFPLSGSALLPVELSVPVKEGLVEAMQAVRQAAVVLGSFMVQRTG